MRAPVGGWSYKPALFDISFFYRAQDFKEINMDSNISFPKNIKHFSKLVTSGYPVLIEYTIRSSIMHIKDYMGGGATQT